MFNYANKKINLIQIMNECDNNYNEKNNIYNGQILSNEKKRINIIIGLIEKCKSRDKSKYKLYDKLINNYKGIFKIKEIQRLKKISILKKTKDYLKNEIDKLILKNESKYLLEELINEFDKINKLITANYI
jgi:hypothetical protein